MLISEVNHNIPTRSGILALQGGEDAKNYALPEILNPIQKRAGGDRAVETLDLLTKSGGFRLRHLAQEDFDRGRAMFRRTSEIELPDLVTVAYMRRTGLEFIYSFDDDFDRFDDVTRLTTPENPFS